MAGSLQRKFKRTLWGFPRHGEGSCFFPSRSEAFLGIVVLTFCSKKEKFRRRNYARFLIWNCAYMGDHGVGSVDTIGNVVGKCFFSLSYKPHSQVTHDHFVTFIGQVDGRFLLFPFPITWKACGSKMESVFFALENATRISVAMVLFLVDLSFGRKLNV